MITLQGKGVYRGIAIGELYFYHREQTKIKRYHIDDTEAEKRRFREAQDITNAHLSELYEKALSEVGEMEAAIFQIHQMMLADADYCESIENIIETEQVNAEYAIGVTADNFAHMFSCMEDDYMRERATDVRDISERLLQVFSGTSTGIIAANHPIILAADDLTPSETVQLDTSKILALVTTKGSVYSHTAILARTMGIAAVIGAEAAKETYNGCLTVVDGSEGMVYIDPDQTVLEQMREKKRMLEEQTRLLDELRGMPNVTKSGRSIEIYANIGGPEDVGAVLQNDAGGIGLFRSEFLYLNSSHYPDEEMQFNAYRRVVQDMGGRPVTIRTLDIGADKKIGYFNLPQEENPALGYRAIRICLTRPDIFKTQLRALYRASVFGDLSVMFPMIISLDEVRRIKQLTEEVKEELRTDGIPFCDDMKLGIMIETPAAAIMSDKLAGEVDFFSIGTNDLAQYTLALDRQNDMLEEFYHPHHCAVLRLIELVAKNAHDAGIPVGICGELGADIELTERFLDMGIDKLSVSPSMVLPIRGKVRSCE